MKNRTCYIARYPSDGKGNLREEILVRDTYSTQRLLAAWENLTSERKPDDPMLQMWYSDDYQATCLAETNQPIAIV